MPQMKLAIQLVTLSLKAAPLNSALLPSASSVETRVLIIQPVGETGAEIIPLSHASSSHRLRRKSHLSAMI